MGSLVSVVVSLFWQQAVGFVVAAYSVYSSVAASNAQKKAERAARRDALDRNSRRNYRAPVPEKTLVYGIQRIAGPYMYIQNKEEGNDLVFIAFVKTASHEIDAFLNFYLDEDELTVPGGIGGAVTGKFAGSVEIYPFLGSDSQDVGARLTACGATDILSTDKFAGMAGFVVKTTNLTRNFEETQGNFSARIRGAKVETTGGTVEYSTNPAYCAADYLRRFQGVTDSEIDATALAASVLVCDESVAVNGGGTIPRYACNGLLLLSESEHRENLRALADCMAGNLVYSSGAWHIEAGRWIAPTSEDEYELEDIADEVDLVLENRAEDRPNVVKGRIYSADHNNQEIEFPGVEFARAAGEPERVLDLVLPLVSDHRQAQRIAKIRGNQARSAGGGSFPLTARGLTHKPEDVCRYALPRMGTEKLTARIVEVSRQLEDTDDGLVYRVTHTVAEAAAEDFAWDEATDEKELPQATLTFETGLAKIPQDVTTTETTVPPSGDPPSGGSTEVEVNWTDPSASASPLDFVRVRLLDNGVEEQSQEIAAGVETVTFTGGYLAGPITVALRAFYEDNSTSGEIVVTV